jgi:hypothetical protein
VFVAEAAGGFDEAVVGFRAGVGEEDAAREFDVVGVDLRGELGLEGDLIEVGDVDELAGWQWPREQTAMPMQKSR